MSAAPVSPPAIIRPADPFDLNRCPCPICLMLDARFPGQGWQLALFQYREARRPRA